MLETSTVHSAIHSGPMAAKNFTRPSVMANVPRVVPRSVVRCQWTSNGCSRTTFSAPPQKKTQYAKYRARPKTVANHAKT